MSERAGTSLEGLRRGASGSLRAVFTGGDGEHPGVDLETTAALELRGPFQPAVGPPLYYLRNTTAGILGGDLYCVDLRAEAGANLRVASSSATKAFAMPAGDAESIVKLSAAPESRLVWGTHTTILQEGTRLSQRVEVDLAPGATVILAEVLVLGRLARGEYAAFAAYESSLRVGSHGCSPLYEEAYRLTPEPGLRTSMAGRGVLVSVYGLGIEEMHPGLTFGPDVLAGYSALPKGAGTVVRMLAASASEGVAFADETVLRLLDATQRF